MVSRLDINDMREIAQLKGGKCLSKEYIDQFTPLKWMCEKGHTWDKGYYIIRQGGWCVQCMHGERKKTSLEEINKIAKSKGGKCLSDEYNSKHLKFQCAKGHVWETTAHVIKKGHWCLQCSGAAKLSIEVFQKIAQSKGGKLLSKKYGNALTPLKFQCDKGHIWETKAYSVRNLDTWCPQCSQVIVGINRRTPIDRYIAIAKKHGGKLLSKNYINSHTHLKWQCRKGHKWLAVPAAVGSGQWCRKCFGTQKLTIEEIQQIAKDKGGKCLSKKYMGSLTKLTWQCKMGHTWTAAPSIVKYTSWCPACAKKNRVITRYKKKSPELGPHKLIFQIRK